MSTPVTRGELREELDRFEQKVDLKLDQLEQKVDLKLDQLEQKIDRKLDKLEQRFDYKLEMWGGALLARITESEQRLLTEIGRHIQAAFEAMQTRISAIDEKYADLPARVHALETRMAPPRRR